MNKSIKIIILVVIAVLIVGVTSSLALWVVDEKQTNFNSVATGCIDLSFSNGTGTLSLENTTPMNDSAGLALNGYTFTVTNNCNGEISYLLNLDLFNVENSTNLPTSKIKLVIDNEVPRKLAYYEDTSVNDANAYGAKTLYAGKLASKASDTHTVKMWVDENTDNTYQNAVFSNRLFTMASPDLVVPEVAADDCFVMDGIGNILMYKTAYCPSKVIVPNNIQGQDVIGVAEGAFRDANVLTIYDSLNANVDFVILDENNYDTLSDIITGIISLGGIEGGSVTNYSIYKASEYNNWSLFDTGLLDGNNREDTITGSVHNVSHSHRLNIPLALNPTEYNTANGNQGFVAASFDAYYNCSSCYYGNQGITSNSIQSYLESIDFSKCSMLTLFDQYSISYNNSLTKIEVPNNIIQFNNNCFANNNLSSIFIPTHVLSIKEYAFGHNNINNVELFSTGLLELYSNVFSDNNISSLVVNSTVDVSNATSKPFSNTSLTSSGITIGYYSTNSASDFIDVN